MKVRLMCVMHECDLSRSESGRFLIPELLSDVAEQNGIGFGSAADGETGYFLFDLSECWCPEDATDGPSLCSDQWKVVIYG